MAERLYWSIKAGSASSLPPGLGCLTTANASLVAYVSDPEDPDGLLLDFEHDDVLSQSVVGGRRVAVLLCQLISATFNSGTGKWELTIEYDETALEDAERLLTVCDIAQVECFACDTQAKIMGGFKTGEESPEWNSGYGAYLSANGDLDPGGLDDITPE